MVVTDRGNSDEDDGYGDGNDHHEEYSDDFRHCCECYGEGRDQKVFNRRLKSVLDFCKN